MQLIYPIGLLALAGIIIPVIIHLWSIKQGKTLKIGSISLLGESASATSKSFRLTDWLLFILRCLLLILIAFVLTQPFLKKKFKPTSNSGWILVEGKQFANVYQNHKQRLDSLLNLGFELHELNLGFQELKLADTIRKFNETTHLSYSSLLKKLNTQMPVGYTAYIFADKKINNFGGELPKTSIKLIWKDISTADTVKTWSTQFLGRTYEGKSMPSLTAYTAVVSPKIPAPLSVAIYEPYGNDSKYVKAGLGAIEDFTKREIIVQDLSASTAAQADIVFWLSEKEIEPYLAKLKPSAKIFTYQKGKVADVSSILNLAKSTEGNGAIKLYKHIQTNNQKGKIVWADGFGEPVLLSETKNEHNYFYFYSRFNPQWTDLVWNEQFVNALMPMVLGEQNSTDFGFETNSLDQRLITSNQHITTTTNKTALVPELSKNKPLDQVILILAFITLLIERILSFRKIKLNNVKS